MFYIYASLYIWSFDMCYVCSLVFTVKLLKIKCLYAYNAQMLIMLIYCDAGYWIFHSTMHLTQFNNQSQKKWALFFISIVRCNRFAFLFNFLFIYLRQQSVIWYSNSNFRLRP